MRDNVKVFTKNMTRITEKGFVDSDGVLHEADVIICATGYVSVDSLRSFSEYLFLLVHSKANKG